MALTNYKEQIRFFLYLQMTIIHYTSGKRVHRWKCKSPVCLWLHGCYSVSIDSLTESITHLYKFSEATSQRHRADWQIINYVSRDLACCRNALSSRRVSKCANFRYCITPLAVKAIPYTSFCLETLYNECHTRKFN